MKKETKKILLKINLILYSFVFILSILIILNKPQSNQNLLIEYVQTNCYNDKEILNQINFTEGQKYNIIKTDFKNGLSKCLIFNNNISNKI